MPRGKKKAEEVLASSVMEEVPPLKDKPTGDVVKVPVALARTSFDVHASDGGLVRTYSVELHGEDAEKLAHQYAGKISGTVK